MNTVSKINKNTHTYR